MKIEEAKKLYMQAKKAYYGSATPILTDAQFDKLESAIARVDPKWSELKKTGIRLGKKEEGELPFAMPSLNKITYEQGEAVLTRWVTKHVTNQAGLIVMPKYDGCSLQIMYDKGNPVALATRGDATTGSYCSYFLPHLPQLPRNLAYKKTFAVRVEGVMPKSVFQKKYADSYDAARNMVSGLFNSQEASKALRDVHFVALRLQSSTSDLVSGLNFLESQGFLVTPYTQTSAGKTELGIDKLKAFFVKQRAQSDYELDGLVLHSQADKLPLDGDKPSYAVAWKWNDTGNAPTATVKRILWNVSRHGQIIPKAELEPIRVQGATVRYATLNNAKWAQERGIGPGAQVRLVRSGEIIPKIIEVVKKGRFSLPDKALVGSYAWDKSETHIVVANVKDNAEASANGLIRFFKAVDADGFGDHVCELLTKIGVSNTLAASRMDDAKMRQLDLGEKQIANLQNEWRRVKEEAHELSTLMAASGCFGKSVGTTRIESMFAENPKWFAQLAKGEVPEDLKGNVAGISGCGPAFAEVFEAGVNQFCRWLVKADWKIKPRAAKRKAASGSMSGQFGTWTGYRSQEEEALFESQGGQVVPFGSKTTVLFYKADGKASSKIDKAQERGVRVSVFSKFVKG